MLDFEGRLYGSQSGYLLLQVPNSLAIGAYQALPETGVVLPSHNGAAFNAHITVMRPDEVERVGGFAKINERGKTFAYSVVGADSIAASTRDSRYSRYWVLRVRSAELNRLRRTYGLPSEPEAPFHISFAARPRHVVFENGTSKLSEMSMSLVNADPWKSKIGADMELVNSGD